MKIRRFSIRELLSSIGNFCFLALIFGIPYTQPPLYTENQNTKFLQGLARAGLGFLNEDWLANTLDPLPVFSFFVYFTYRYFNESLFYFYYLIFFGIYIYSILAILSGILNYDIKSSSAKYFTYLALIIAIHSTNFQLFSFDFRRHFHWGVAKQTVLGLGFQTATFGVLIILSIYIFLRQHPFWAVLLLDIAASFHPTYILSAAILTLSYLVILIKENKNIKQALAVGLLAFALILPVYSYTRFAFTPTSPEIWKKSLDLLVEFRIPHHSLPAVWLSDNTAYIQTAIVIWALYLIRKTKLFLIMLIPFLTAITLTVAQILLDSSSLAFLAPWRLSVFLVPLSSCILIAHFVCYFFEKHKDEALKNDRAITRLSIALISIFVLIGTVNQTMMFLDKDSSIKMMKFVKQAKQSNEVYLIPIDSKEFRSFRLYTGAPIFINLKSHPYKDVEVIEWYNRVQRAKEFYDTSSQKSCQALRNLASDYRITHVVLEKNNFDKQCDLMEEVYKDKHYGVYKIKSS